MALGLRKIPVIFSFCSLSPSYMDILDWYLLYRCVMRICWSSLNFISVILFKQSYAPWTWKNSNNFEYRCVMRIHMSCSNIVLVELFLAELCPLHLGHRKFLTSPTFNLCYPRGGICVASTHFSYCLSLNDRGKLYLHIQMSTRCMILWLGYFEDLFLFNNILVI